MGLGFTLFVAQKSAENGMPFPPRPPTPAPGFTIPDGFSLSSDPELAYRWDVGWTCVKAPCWHMTVTTVNGCPFGGHIRLTMFTANDIPLGDADDRFGPIRAGEKAYLTFEASDERAAKVRIGKVTCQ